MAMAMPEVMARDKDLGSSRVSAEDRDRPVGDLNTCALYQPFFGVMRVRSQEIFVTQSCGDKQRFNDGTRATSFPLTTRTHSLRLP